VGVLAGGHITGQEKKVGPLYGGKSKIVVPVRGARAIISTTSENNGRYLTPGEAITYDQGESLSGILISRIPDIMPRTKD
jgi:hypothetical protein